MASHHPDEGYSGGTHSPGGDDQTMMQSEGDMPVSQSLRDAVMKLPQEERLALIQEVSASLTTPLLFRLHAAVGSMVYFDPVSILPNELILQIFAHLSPKDLLTASLVSKPWRERSQDEELWHHCFAREGWVLDRAKLSLNEDFARKNGTEFAEKVMRSERASVQLERRESRKRPRDEAFSETESTRVHAGQETTADSDEDTTDGMEGIETPSGSSGTPALSSRDALMDGIDVSSSSSAQISDFSAASPNQFGVKIEPTVFTAGQDTKVSWPYLYKHRRRLEKNWEHGKFVSFRLPLPEFEHEGHQECVYTIQYSGNHLVSGSRDRTIRIWDLDTYRLIGKPLRGHDMSVLCLQFDDRPGDDHDVIISGGSDHYVIVWRFSTGEIINKMTTAHDESVLNLRFDDRYLVTCSKDKTIKIWNRKEIARDDPLIPLRVLSKFAGEADIGIPLRPYTLLDVLVGHVAAVNAVQIHQGIIVSASGDRTIRSWDISSSTMKKMYVGHTKGIACVQFDGRRIVSGSSDNSVQIFDYESQACIATLDGHSNLVRTVQARFGDLDIMTDEELLSQSKEADRNFLRALGQGMETPNHSRRGRRRNAGSSRPEDMLSYGTKIPPGGGGSRWAKIVSGSYDENVIIWKRDDTGAWRASQRLVMSAVNNQQNNTGRPARPGQIPVPPIPTVGGAQGGPGALGLAAANAHAQLQGASAYMQLAQNAFQHPSLNNVPGWAAAHINNIQNAQHGLTVTMQGLAQNGQQQQQQQQQLPPPPADPAPANQPAALLAGQGTPPTAGQAPGPNQAAQAGNANGNANAPHHHHHHHHHHHGQHHHHHHGQNQQAANHHGGNQRETNRVFKLQFDARRIIACSQKQVIVGWDFANGDKDLEWIGSWSVETA